MESVEKGRKLVLTIIITILLISILSIVLYNIRFGSIKLGSQIVRLILNITLCYFLYKGYQWSKIIMIILMGIAALTGILGIVVLLDAPLVVILLIILSIVYSYCCVKLIISQDIKEYMIHKRDNN